MRTIDDMTTTTEELIASIEKRLHDLNEEIGALSAARTALDGHAAESLSPRGRTASVKATASRSKSTSATPSPTAGTAPPVEAAVESAGPPPTVASSAPPGAPRRRARRRPRAKAARREVVPAGKLELLLAETDGLTTSVLAERANGDRDQVLTLLRELEQTGRVRRTGQRRSTRWHVISDEERIQQRAAELAAQSRSAA
jgi:hypothetical protein